MKLVTIRTPDGTRAARQEGDEVIELAYTDVGALLAAGPEALQGAATTAGARRPLADVDLRRWCRIHPRFSASARITSSISRRWGPRRPHTLPSSPSTPAR